MDQWRGILGFEGYSVSTEGLIRNDDTERIMRQTVNSNGVIMIGLMKGKTQYKRSVSVLVSSAFIPKPNKAFDTPIHLNGNKHDARSSNLAWRPLWFARKYHSQFPIQGGYSHPVEDIATEDQYESVWDAVVTHGILERDIFLSIANGAAVFPTFQYFKAVYR